MKPTTRRELLRALGLAFAATPLVKLAACGSDNLGGAANPDAAPGDPDASGVSRPDATGVSSPDASGVCATIPEETAGPYPDIKGMISNPSFYRSDIREDRTGVPLTLTLRVVDSANGCAPVSGANVEIWHCDATGVYSEYSNSMNAGSTASTFLRGVQTADSDGKVTFTTIYPGWYQGRCTHIHIQVYDGTTLKKTTQLCFPETVNALVDASYGKGQNPTTNENDMVFSDGDEYQLATISGDNEGGYVASNDLGVPW